MKKKLMKYIFAALFGAVFLWFYFQVSTYPYKVARWFQPIEAKAVSLFARKCSEGADWLGIFGDYAINHLGGYSAQVAFLGQDKTLHHCEIGYKQELFRETVNVSSRYRYASTSKLVTMSAIMRLIAEGKINLGDTLVSFFPELTTFRDPRIQQITIAHLLNHRAGFDRRTLLGDPMFLRAKSPWCPNHLNKLKTLKLAFSPDEKQIYSNIGYCLLGEIIKRVTSEKYHSYAGRQFSLTKRNIKFISNYYYEDEVRYDYRYENSYNDSYLKLFDFDAVSAAAGLSGSATALTELLWDIQHEQKPSPFDLAVAANHCNIKKLDGCLILGVNHYRPEKEGLTLHYHEGYLPGSASVAVVDSYGGVTVVLKSGANKYQKNSNNRWIPWIYKRLTLYYVFQGKLPVLDSLSVSTNH